MFDDRGQGKHDSTVRVNSAWLERVRRLFKQIEQILAELSDICQLPSANRASDEEP
jgi:flagellar biosynthesis/type III secretory pathway protein FliH